MLLGQHVYVEPDFGQTEVKDGIWIDESYVVKDGDDAYVWTLNKKDKLEKTKVELGDYDENLMMYEIKSGLTKDDYIVWASDDLYEGEAQTWEEYVENGGGEDSVYDDMGTEALMTRCLRALRAVLLMMAPWMMAQWTKVLQMPPVQVTRRYSR